MPVLTQKIDTGHQPGYDLRQRVTSIFHIYAMANKSSLIFGQVFLKVLLFHYNIKII